MLSFGRVAVRRGKEALLALLSIAALMPLACRAESVLDKIRDAEKKLEQLSHSAGQPGGAAVEGAAANAADTSASGAASDSDGPCCTKASVEQAAKTVGYVDVIGIKLGMTPEQVVAAIRSHNPKLRVGIVKSRFVTPSGRFPGPTYAIFATDAVGTHGPHEVIGVQFTTEPSPQFADMIFRYVAFFPDRPVTSTIVNALHKKYGTENFENSLADHEWVHGADRQLLTSLPQPTVRLCAPQPGRGGALWTGNIAAGMMDWLNNEDRMEDLFSGHSYADMSADSTVVRPLNTPGQTDPAVQPSCRPYTYIGAYVASAGPSAEIYDFSVAAYSPALAYDSQMMTHTWLQGQVDAVRQQQEKAAKERAAPPM